jgi:Asp-tRNA(Asn)/Glu-tRNA(Gln) amidotransferase C subunit
MFKIQNKRYNEIVDSQLSVMDQQVKKQKADIDQIITRTEQMKAIFQPNLQKAYLEVQKLRYDNAKTQAERSMILQNIENAKKDEELKRLDIELKRLGIMPGDNLFMRVLGRALANPKDQKWHKENKPNKIMDR